MSRMKLLKDFETFAVKGNAVDLAVGIVIGAAFGQVTTALANGIITPPISLLIGGVDFTRLVVPIGGGAEIAFGAFLQALVNFVLIALALFFMVKLFSSLTRKRKEEENLELLREKGRFFSTNEQLHEYIGQAYLNEIEPLQDGILLYKELGIKLKVLKVEEQKATYCDLRSWAEPFLDTFLKVNSRVPQHVVTAFRRLSSIPLPPKNS